MDFWRSQIMINNLTELAMTCNNTKEKNWNLKESMASSMTLIHRIR